MPQISTKPQPAKRLIPATMPLNISAVDRKKLEDDMREKAKAREEAIHKENEIPTIASKIIRFELRRFGRYWQGYVMDGKRSVAVLPGPSNLPGVLGALDAAVTDAALKA